MCKYKVLYVFIFFRQLSNRDAALRSRERKKMYVRDLELKSRYLESECRRLGHVLQCCFAENQALRLHLQNEKAYGASVTKQESAVLLMGTKHYISLNPFSVLSLVLMPPFGASNFHYQVFTFSLFDSNLTQYVKKTGGKF